MNTVLFEPAVSTITAGVCSSKVSILGDGENNVVLLSSQTIITDSDDHSNRVTLQEDDMESLFGSAFLPRSGMLEGDFALDGPANGFSGAFSVNYFVIGAGTKGSAKNFIGNLECVE